jgi:AraC-like DNA-binding protein
VVEHSRLPAEHATRSPTLTRHAVLAPIAARVFELLGVGASFFHRSWLDLRESIGVAAFELEHGQDLERFAYNTRCIEEALRTRATVRGRHAGFADLFVPVSVDGRADAVLVTGPFATERATSVEILERWRALTGRAGSLEDPEFFHYVTTTLATLSLDAPQTAAFSRLVERLASLMAGRGSAPELYVEIESCMDLLMGARLADRMWEAARAMVDEATSRSWAALSRDAHKKELGLTRFPEHALVGAFVSRAQGTSPLDDLLVCDAFRRACIDLARSIGNVVTGKVGDNGVSFLLASRAPPDRARAKLLDLGERATALAKKRFGISLYLGVGPPSGPLSQKYQGALFAAESALARGVPVVHARAGGQTTCPLGRHRQGLARLAADEPAALPIPFDRFLEAVASRSGYRLEAARAHVEAGFERIAEALLRKGEIDPKSVAALRAELERRASESGTMGELCSLYRAALRDILVAAPRGAARSDRSLRRAETFMRRHFREPLTLAGVARVAGFAPTYFSELFHEEQGVTFGRYLTRLRVERAKTLLSDTSLGLSRIAEMSGFRTGRYLGRVFKSVTRETPALYRRRALRGATS